MKRKQRKIKCKKKEWKKMERSNFWFSSSQLLNKIQNYLLPMVTKLKKNSYNVFVMIYGFDN